MPYCPSGVDVQAAIALMAGVLLSIGHGYCAEALRRRLGAGWRVIATTRDEGKAARLRAAGAEAVIWPGSDLTPLLERATHLLSSVPPVDGADPVAAVLSEAGGAAMKHLVFAGYYSTTGVYGDHDGGWVDEDAALAAGTTRGRARLAAEAAWRALGLPLHVFRLAAIYGPGRSAFERLEAGTARRVSRPGLVFSRIHVADIARITAAAMAAPRPGAVWNLADDMPAPPEDVIVEAARLMGISPPPERSVEAAGLSGLARDFYSESKRVANARVKRSLGLEMLYADYRTGLRAILDARAAGGRDG
mgnify:CR=1 FL=1